MSKLHNLGWKHSYSLKEGIRKTYAWFKKDYGLKDQIQRAGVSIISNIAEGFDSGSIKAFINFLNYSYRSTSEVQSLLFVALDQCYIVRNEFDELYKKTDKIKNLIGGFIKYLRNSMNKEPRTINKITTNIEQRTK